MKTSWSVLAALTIASTPAFGNLVINPTYASNITSDPNSASIINTIQTAIDFYHNTFADNITVNITFQEGGGLGGSSFNLFAIPYTTFYNALVADGKSSDDATALARLATDGIGSNNPVTGGTSILIKQANARALGISVGSGSDGTITLNTALTTPGSPGSTLQYSLLAVAEHEIDEILGLGSTLGLGLSAPFNNDPSPEDFFRFVSGNTRSFSLAAGTPAFFSLDGTTNLAGFNSPGCDGCSDYGDWNSGPTPRVQDAFATPGAFPAMGVEIRALDAIGYDLAPTVVPEPGSMMLLGAGLAAFAMVRRRRAA
jgi:hypothetical protein